MVELNDLHIWVQKQNYKQRGICEVGSYLSFLMAVESPDKSFP